MNRFIDLLKPKIVVFQLITYAFGFWMATIYTGSQATALWMGLLGTMLLAVGSAVGNNIIERRLDAKMKRTENRALVVKSIPMGVAGLCCGLGLLSGGWVLFSYTNLPTFICGLATVVLYVAVYTPLKTVSWVNTYVGAVPGALVPLGGWLTHSPSITPVAMMLFMWLFIWQLPHFFAIAWMYKNDYQKAGFKMLPEFDPKGMRTARQIVYNSFLLILVAAFPFMMKMTSYFYLIVSVLLGIYLCSAAIRFSKDKTFENARSVLRRSVVYLPLMLLSLIIDIYAPKLWEWIILVA